MVPDLGNPTILIVFEFGVTNELLHIQTHHQNYHAAQSGKTHPDDSHYLFVACSCGPETYKSIPVDAVRYYQSKLATGGLI
jgi:hypothetical protein